MTQGKRKRRKVPRRLKPHVIETIRLRWTTGESQTSLAKEYDVDPRTIARWKRLQGWERPNNKPPEKETPDISTEIDTSPTSKQKVFVETNTGELLRPQGPAAAPPALIEATGRQLRVAETVWRIIETFLDKLQTEGVDGSPEVVSRSIHSLTQSLERLQKVERTALDADVHKDQRVNVVIVVPAKQTVDDWQRLAVDAQVESVDE